ncbi:MAG TPA: sugar isomerase [Micromonosporaceae bacterium]|nr:sugar isomerase [Micromonosporaceae bacterium]
MRCVEEEIASQPGCWVRAAEVAAASAGALPRPGETVAVVGCGTSWFMAQAYASLREQAGHGRTDAFAASEMPGRRGYDRILVITRSGTTTEVLDLLGRVGEVAATAVTADPAAPVAGLVGQVVALDFADERAVVQTRFATTALALLRAHLGHDLRALAEQGERALAVPVQPWVDAEQVTFLGRGWAAGIAHEAALKGREAAQLWTESYPAMEYRHGPISIAQPGRLVWMFGEPPAGLAGDVAATGATFVTSDLDPMAHLVVAQRLAVTAALARGLDPDRPRHLPRSVVLHAG